VTPLDFHRGLPGYAPTPLRDARTVAAAVGAERVWVKDESSRLGLPAFKVLGASWAVYRVLCKRLGREPEWHDLDELRTAFAPLGPLTVAAATDGNHGRAVAHMAALLGLDAQILVPAGTAQARVDAIAGEGAAVTVVDGSYDDAVARSAALAGPRCLVISDTSWPGYEDTPRDVIAGYATIFHEIDAALAQRDQPPPDLVFVQVGVGALAAALVRHYRQRSNVATSERSNAPAIVGVEPDRAACVLASLQAGQIVAIPGPHDSIMAGLNCGTPSLVAWPAVSGGIGMLMAIPDDRAREGMRALAADGVVAGETGAAGAGGLIDLCAAPDAAAACAAIGLGPTSRVLLLCTEGATDPLAYRQVVGPASVI